MYAVRDAFIGASLTVIFQIGVAAWFYQPAPPVEKVIEYRYACPLPYETILNRDDAIMVSYHLTPLRKEGESE